MLFNNFGKFKGKSSIGLRVNKKPPFRGGFELANFKETLLIIF